MNTLLKLLFTMLLLAPQALPEDRKKNGRERENQAQRAERKRREKIDELSRQLARRMAIVQPSEESTFLNARASALIERMRSAQEDYRFDRLRRSADALLEASERIYESREPEDKDDDDREKSARSLQRYYFQVQQAEYFSGMSLEPDGPTYVKHARSLYQQARSAYDARHYDRARHLGEAAALLVTALEYLAQAAVRTPDPPRLNE